MSSLQSSRVYCCGEQVPQVFTDSHKPPCQNIKLLDQDQGGTPSISVGTVGNLVLGNGSTIVIGKQSTSKALRKEIPAKHPVTSSQKTPTMEQKLDIKDKVGKDWKDLGRRLGFCDSELEQIESDNSRNCSEVIYQILIKWEQQSPDPATQQRLAQVFLKMKRGDLADLLQDGS